MRYIIKNITIYDGTKNMKPKVGYDILVNEGKIEKIGQNLDEKVKIIDGTNKFVIPGLINLHVHIPGSGKPSKKPTNNKALVAKIEKSKLFAKVCDLLYKKYIKEELYSGVTTIRSVGGIGYYDTKTRDLVNEGKWIGPRILASNYAITVKGGHMEGTVSKSASSVKEFKEKVRDVANSGADLIKIMITGGVLDATVRGEPGVLRMKPAEVKACCEEAHKLGLKVAAHVESSKGVKVALENGVDTIEHGALLDEHCIELFKKNNASYITTISPTMPLAMLSHEVGYTDDMIQFNTMVVGLNVIKGTKQALDNKINVGLGTDTGCPFTTHYNFYREMIWFENILKESKKSTLYHATLGNAKILGLDKEIGSIEEGKAADMVIVNKDPFETFENLSTPNMVIFGGKIINNPKVKKDKYTEDALNSIQNVSLKDIEDLYNKIK